MPDQPAARRWSPAAISSSITLYIIDTCGTAIAPPVANAVSRTPPLSLTEILTVFSVKSAVTRRPRSRADGPFGVRTSITIRRIVPSPFRPNSVCRRRTNGQRSTPSATSRVDERSTRSTATVSLPRTATKP